MPVIPNIQILRVLEKRPFSTRSRDERRSRSQPSTPKLRTRTPPPPRLRHNETIYFGKTPVTIIDNGTSELNIRPQESLSVASAPPLTPLNRLRHTTSKWFSNKRAAKAIKAQVECQDEAQRLSEVPKAFKAVHFDGTPEYIEDSFSITPSLGTCPQWVGIRSTMYYSMSDPAENPSDLQPGTLVRRVPRRRRSGPPIEYRYDSRTPASSNSSPTPTTVICSNVRSKVSSDLKDLAEALKKFPIDERSPRTQPVRIETFEDISALKVYLETFYNDRYMQPRSERCIRRQRLIDHLAQSSLSSSEKDELLRSWTQSESTHLRQLRTLKTTSVARHATKGVFHAGFQEVRILSRGTFGLVKLVTDADHFVTEDPSPCMSNGTPHPTLVPRGCQNPHVMKDYYAMKVIRKAEMIRTSQEGHLRGERDFLVKAEGSQWVVPLIASFQDNTNLYLVMEFMIGGDFLQYLCRHDILSEDDTRFYMAEMVLAIEETHRLGWIHRDVKPDNFLIHSSGHLKISDFGLAFDGHWSHINDYYDTTRHSILNKYNIHLQGDDHDAAANRIRGTPRMTSSRLPYEMHNARDMEELLREPERMRKERPQSIVGTKQYMAPEVILGHTYDGRCDWWSLGCIIFERYGNPNGSQSFFSRTPFLGADRQTTARNIVHHRDVLRFPSGERLSGTGLRYPAPTDCALALMKDLLREKDHRLGSASYGPRPCRHLRRHHNISEPSFVAAGDAEDIKAHPFFKTIRWDTLHRTRAPFIPEPVEDIAEFFEHEDTFLNDVGTSYMSLREKVKPEAEPRANRRLLGPYFERWQAEQREIEKVQMGIETWTDANVAACKREKGERWDAFKQSRIKKTRDRKLQQGKDPDLEVKQILGSRPRKCRPKDILVRDVKYGQRVVERRKRGAFLGYTYRSPRYVFPEVGKERRPVFSRPTIMPVADHDDE
ncbi:kinase-like protein [Aureobasidium sp. EXF-10728]|nr:kinase-like protein [Aureobasidium sp. EXF-10728]